MKYKITAFEIIRILIIIITATFAFGSAFQKIENNKQDIDLLKAYYKDVSSSLNCIAKDVSKIDGKVELIIKKVY